MWSERRVKNNNNNYAEDKRKGEWNANSVGCSTPNPPQRKHNRGCLRWFQLIFRDLCLHVRLLRRNCQNEFSSKTLQPNEDWLYLNVNAIGFVWHRNRKEGDIRKTKTTKNNSYWKREKPKTGFIQNTCSIYTTTNTRPIIHNGNATFDHIKRNRKNLSMEWIMFQFTFIACLISWSDLCSEWTVCASEVWHNDWHSVFFGIGWLNGFVMFDGFQMSLLIQTEDD